MRLKLPQDLYSNTKQPGKKSQTLYSLSEIMVLYHDFPGLVILEDCSYKTFSNSKPMIKYRAVSAALILDEMSTSLELEKH